MFTGAVFFKAVPPASSSRTACDEQCMALSMHLYTLATQVPNVPESLPYATAVVLLGSVLARQRDGDRAAGVAARAEEVVSRWRAGRPRRGSRPAASPTGRRRSSTASRSTSCRNEILAIIGPAQSGKTSLLRCLNRTIDFTRTRVSRGGSRSTARTSAASRDVYELRRKIGMVAPLPVGLPLSIYDNVAFAPRSAGMRRKADLDEIVERCLRQAALWDEVKDRLDSLGTRALRRPAAAAHDRARALAPAGDPLPRRVLDRHRPRHDDADRGRAEGAAATR